MKSNYLIFLLFTCFASTISAQTSFFERKNIFFELNLFIGELQIKDSPFNEKFSLGYGGEIAFGSTNRSNWSIKIGLDFFSQEVAYTNLFSVNYSNPNNNTFSNNDFFIENLTNSFSNYDIGFNLKFDGSNCENPDATPMDGEPLSLGFRRLHLFQQFGIPITLEKAFGKKKLKLYLGVGAKPVLFIRDNQFSEKYRNSGSVHLRGYRYYCFNGNTGVQQIFIENQDFNFISQNIENTRLDLMSEIGILHNGIKNTFKFTLFFHESLSPFNTIDGNNYRAKIVGIKFALRKNLN